MKTIVTDTYDFPTLIRNGNVYVDKTKLLHRLVSKVDGTLFFMSRPRRFGKSLMISTLKQCRERNYAAPYGADKRKVIYVGINYKIANAAVEVACEPVNEPVFQAVLKDIAQRPGQRRPALLKRIKASEARMKRVLSELIRQGQIEFRGAPKTGGYYAK